MPYFLRDGEPYKSVIAETNNGRAILRLVDGVKPKGVEGDADISWRKEFLRRIGYKL